MTITQYVLIGSDDEEIDTAVYEQSEYQEAKEEARKAGAAVLAREFEYSDSSIVDDFREGSEA